VHESGLAETKRLSEAQLTNFDHDFVDDELFASIASCLDARFPSGEFTFLDVGGGIGFFTDRILERYEKASGIVLDNAPILLEQNAAHPRKRLVLEVRHCRPQAVAPSIAPFKRTVPTTRDWRSIHLWALPYEAA
jgi:hypothetical protein